MLKIRLFRIGKKQQPSYKIVVVDKREAPKGGRFMDELGFVNPINKEKSLDKEKAKHWISKGAQPSDTIYNLFVKEGVIEGKKKDVHKKSKKEAPKVEEKPSASVETSADKEEKAPEPEKKEESRPEEKKEEPEKKEEEAPKEEKKEEAPKEEKKEEVPKEKEKKEEPKKESE